MRVFTTALQLVGLGAIVAGVAMIWVPAGLIVAGVAAVVVGHLLDDPGGAS